MLTIWPFFPVLAHGFADAGPLPVPTPVLFDGRRGLAPLLTSAVPEHGGGGPDSH